MRYFYIHLLALLWCFALFGAMAFRVYLERDYPYMKEPIETLNYWIGYYPDTAYAKGEELGVLGLRDSVFVLDHFIYEGSKFLVPPVFIERMQLNFAFVHQAAYSRSLTDPWRIANEGGLLLGTRIPLYIQHLSSHKTYGPYYAQSQAPHQFEFHWGFKEVVAKLPSGRYALRLAIEEADIPPLRRKLVQSLFSPTYYPGYEMYFEIPIR
ncbi:MAG: hypothetical protein AAF694_22635 [Bacteroidota bacterium]